MAHDDDLDSNPVLLMVTTVEGNSPVEAMYLDTGCSNHMTCNLNWLVNLDESRKFTIKFADHSTVRSMGIGNVAFRRNDGILAIIE